MSQVPGIFYVNESLKELVFEELEAHSQSRGVGGFLPAVCNCTHPPLIQAGQANWKCCLPSWNSREKFRDARYPLWVCLFRSSL